MPLLKILSVFRLIIYIIKMKRMYIFFTCYKEITHCTVHLTFRSLYFLHTVRKLY